MTKAPLLFSIAAIYFGVISPCFGQQVNTSVANNAVKGNPFSKNITRKDILQSSAFIENKDIYEPYQGQKVEYMLSHQGMVAFFTKEGIVYKLCTVSKHNEVEEEKEKKEGKEEGSESALKAHYFYIRMQWEGANPDPKIVSSGQQDGDHVYLKRDDDSYKSIRTQGYQKITYQDLYPGIDVEYTVPDNGGIEYSLIVHPGADVSQVKMTYSGDMTGLRKDKAGDIIIKSKGGDIIEHAPNSYYATNAPIASPFHLKRKSKSIGFKMPDDYDRSQTVIIDPWVTTTSTLTSSEVGYIVDYDYEGNLFVYGGGAYPQEYSVVKYYFGGGAPAYTFNGYVASQNWHAWGIEYDPGSFAVDKSTGKVYIGQGVDAVVNYYYETVEGANQIIRIDSSGNYDNFISTTNTDFVEAWGFTYNCANSTILIAGGSYTTNINFGILNPVNANVSAINITGITTNSDYPYVCDRQDIASLAQDPQGDVFAIFSAPYYEAPQNPSVGNKIYKLNATLNGNLWNTASGYASLNEFQNHPSFINPEAFEVGDCTGNGYNGLAANNNYVFYYDGSNLKAFNNTTGTQAGSATTVPGGTVLYQGGIAVDNCNNVYLGGKGQIYCYSFNGTSFTQGTSISLGAGYTSDYVYDVRYNSANNMLYATGIGFAGIYTATLSTTCVTNLLSIATIRQCTSAIANVTPSNTVSNPVFTYVWTDTAGNVVGQTNSTTLESDTLTGVPAGKYYIKAFMNLNCAASFQYDSVYVGAALMVNGNDSSVCKGQSITLTATADTVGGTYTWTPGSLTGSSITVTPDSTTTYLVSYSICNATDTARIIITPAPTLSPTIASICSGDSITVMANPSVAGGTYSWTPGGYTTDSFKVAPTGNTIYNVTYSIPGCSNVTGSARISVTPNVTLAPGSKSIDLCAGNTVQLTETPSTGGGTYSWSPGGGTTGTITIAPTVDSVYTLTYTLNSCSVTINDTVTVNPQPTLPNTTVGFCSGNSTQIIADPSVSGGTYSWAPGGATSDTILVSPIGSTTYTVTYDLNGCTATGSHVINVSPQPTLSKSNISICDGTSGQLVATPSEGGGTFTWSPGGATSGTISVNPTINTVYTVTYDLNGCSATANDTVTVTPQPTLAAGNSSTICSGDSTQIIAVPSVGGGTYSWSPGGATTDTILAQPLSGTTYTVTYKLNGCSTTAAYIVNVNPQPVLTSSNLSLCPGNSGQLTVLASIAGGTFSWSPGGATTQSITVVPVSGIYTVTYDLNGCSATASDTVSVINNASIPTYNVVICEGSSVQISVPSSPGATYSWSPVGDTTAAITVSPFVTTIYTVTYSLNGCMATGNDTVNVIPRPDAGPDQSIPLSDTIAMAAAGSGTWSSFSNNPTPVNIADSTDSTTTVSGFLNDGIYGFIWTVNGCSDTVLITVGGGPRANYYTNGAACFPGCIGFKNASTNATHYLWYFPGANPSSDTATNPFNICYDSAGTYNVTLIAFNADVADTLIRNANITIFPIPKDTIIQHGDSLIATAGMFTYQWLFNGDSIYENGNSQVYVARTSGSYTVQVVDSNGCTAMSDSVNFIYNGIAGIADDMTAEVYPNPLISGSWNLSVGPTLIGSTVEIFDADGKRVYQSVITDAQSLITLNIASGVYFMHINSSKYSLVRKLIRL